MGFLSIIQSVATIAAALANWLHDRQLINLATRAALGRKLQEVNDALDRARRARGAAQLDTDLHPERLHDDDGYKRD